MAKDSSTGGNSSKGTSGMAANKNRRSNNDHDNKNRIPNRIVIRHLPPTMTEEEFLNQIEPLPEHDSYYYANADWSLGTEATCRAYIIFKNTDDIYLFRDRFDGYVFVDNRGNEYPAIVEFAPYQNFIRYRSRNVDNKVNTIEDEPIYQQFLKQLEEERAAVKNAECKIEFTLDRKKEEVISTPLLEYIASKREKRLEENRRRGKDKKHSHDSHDQNNKGNWTQSSSGGGQGPTSGSGTSEKNHTERKENTDGGGRKYNDDDKVINNSNNGRTKNNGSNNSNRADRSRRRSDEYKRRTFERNEQMEKKNDKRDRRQNRRDRNQNKNSQGRSSNNNNTIENTGTQMKKDDTSAITLMKSTQPKEILKKSTIDGESLNDSVRTFIFQAAQNFQPKGEENTTNLNPSVDNQVKRSGKKNNINEMTGKMSQFSLNDNDLEKSKMNNESNSTREEKREERRIRNKDRPSIAIYQPKALLRLSEDSETNGGGNKKNSRNRNNNIETHGDEGSKDISSNNQQQSSNNQGSEIRSKRVQRYSERARNRPKQGGYNNSNKQN